MTTDLPMTTPHDRGLGEWSQPRSEAEARPATGPAERNNLYTRNDPKNTIRTSSFPDSLQIQDLGVENGLKQPQNGGKPATKQGGGPRTKNGKEIAVRNNTKHGILSSAPVIRGERKRHWKAHLAGVHESLQPQGHLERELVDRVALALWQLLRLDRYVHAVTEDYMDRPARNDAADDLAANMRSVISGVGGLLLPDHFGDIRASEPEPQAAPSPEQRVIPEKRDLKKIMRYEAHLHRLIDRTLRTLEALQSTRLGKKVYLHRHL